MENSRIIQKRSFGDLTIRAVREMISAIMARAVVPIILIISKKVVIVKIRYTSSSRGLTRMAMLGCRPGNFESSLEGHFKIITSANVVAFITRNDHRVHNAVS
jgi:hypothetical protein